MADSREIDTSLLKGMTEKDLFFRRPTGKAIHKAGSKLRHTQPSEEYDKKAFTVLGWWSISFAYPLDNVVNFIKDKIVLLNIQSSIVSRRIKTVRAIINKLKRFPSMGLETMRDVGGIRVILNSTEDVYRLLEALKTSEYFDVDRCEDYIKQPKDDGYRSVHLVIKYKDVEHPELNGQVIEIQIRTKIQHLWATAVEIFGTIKNISLKTGEGDEKSKEIFRLTSALLSIYEGEPVLARCQDIHPVDLLTSFNRLNSELKMLASMTGLAVSADITEWFYQVLELNSMEKSCRATGFSEDQFNLAVEYYREREIATKNDPCIHVVLISAGNVERVKDAYRNYFLDTKEFTEYMGKTIDYITQLC